MSVLTAQRPPRTPIAPPSVALVPRAFTGPGDTDHGAADDGAADNGAADNGAADRELVAAIRRVGVTGDLADHLADVVRACAVATAPPPHPPATQPRVGDASGSADDGSAGSSDSAGSVLRRAQALLTAVETLTGVAARIDGVLLDATRDLTVANGQLLLAEKGAAGPEELSATGRKRWRARAKSTTRAEIAAATGWGAGEVSDLVALAVSPAAVTQPVSTALATGTATWRLVRSYYRAAAALPHESAAAIAQCLFGDDPAIAATERTTSAGELTDRPWHHREFYRALDREIARHTLADPDRAKATKRHILNSSDLRITADADGTAAVTLTCSMTQAAAIYERIDTGARRVRHSGDPRPLNQIRTAMTTTLLLYGTLGASGAPGTSDAGRSVDPVRPTSSADMNRVLAGLPAATINVIVPLTSLLPRLGAAEPERPDSRPPEPDRPDSRPERQRPEPEPRPPVPTGVAEVTGAHPHFISGADARALAAHPGSTIYRLLTDPATGRCVERSIDAYRFDRAMRDQIAYADHSCRAPGCTAAAKTCEYDHVQEYGTGSGDGDTSEINGALLHGHHHQRKTDKLWEVLTTPTRDMTWTTLLGRIYATKAHDYRQYTPGGSGSDDLHTTDAHTTDVHTTDVHDTDIDSIDSAIYTALSRRRSAAPLALIDDVEEPLCSPSWESIALTHTDDLGRTRPGPPPTTHRTPSTSHLPRTPRTSGIPSTPRTPWLSSPDVPPPF